MTKLQRKLSKEIEREIESKKPSRAGIAEKGDLRKIKADYLADRWISKNGGW